VQSGQSRGDDRGLDWSELPVKLPHDEDAILSIASSPYRHVFQSFAANGNPFTSDKAEVEAQRDSP